MICLISHTYFISGGFKKEKLIFLESVSTFLQMVVAFSTTHKMAGLNNFITKALWVKPHPNTNILLQYRSVFIHSLSWYW